MVKLIKQATISPELYYLGSKALNLDNSNPAEIQDTSIETIDQEAYENGYLEGQESMKTQLTKEMVHLKHTLEQLIQSMPQAIEKNRYDLNADIADIVLMITQQYFIEKATDPHFLELQINSILKELNGNQSIDVYLHPQDIALIHQEKINFSASHLKKVTIKSDESLQSGGCVIKTEHGIFDASIDKQIDKLKTLLIQVKQRGLNA